jgi:alpha-amylase
MAFEYDGFNVDEKNIEWWTWFSQTCRKYNDNVYLVGERWKGEGTIANYYRSGMNYFAFQYAYDTLPWAISGNGYAWARDCVVGWERKIKSRNPRAVSCMFLSNHDSQRSYGRFGDNDIDGDARRKMAAALYLMTPGTPFIYYGEEIGLADFAHNNEAEGVYHDADHRGPMWWSNTNQYSTPAPPDERRRWPSKAPLNGKGVEEQLADDNSLLRFYIKIGNLKNRYRWFSYGYNIESVDVGDGRISALRVANPDNPGQTILLVQNTDQRETVTIKVPRPVTRWYGASVWNNMDRPIGEEWPVDAGTEFNIYGYSSVIFQEY